MIFVVDLIGLFEQVRKRICTACSPKRAWLNDV